MSEGLSAVNECQEDGPDLIEAHEEACARAEGANSPIAADGTAAVARDESSEIQQDYSAKTSEKMSSGRTDVSAREPAPQSDPSDALMPDHPLAADNVKVDVPIKDVSAREPAPQSDPSDALMPDHPLAADNVKVELPIKDMSAREPAPQSDPSDALMPDHPLAADNVKVNVSTEAPPGPKAPALSKPAPTTSGASARKPENELISNGCSKSFGMAWRQHYDKVRDRQPFVKVGVAFAFICTVFASEGLWLPLLLPTKPEISNTEPDYGELEAKAYRKQTMLADMVNAQKDASEWEADPGALEQYGANNKAGIIPQSRQSSVKKTATKSASKAKHAVMVEPVPSDPIRKKYEAIFGPSSDLRAIAIRSSSHKDAGDDKRGARESSTRGLVLRAELLTSVASAPLNAAVIAALTKPTRIGDRTFPAGTQFHGEVRPGDQSPRVFVEFLYARLTNGTTIDLNAVATDLRGREGIPGSRPMTGRTAGSVGLSGGQAAMRTGASVIPGVGGIVASGAAAMADTFADKSQRLDRDEVIVQVDVRTAILIYVRAISVS